MEKKVVISCLLLIAYLFSPIFGTEFTFFTEVSERSEIFILGAVTFGMILCYFTRGESLAKVINGKTLFFIQLIISILFIVNANGRLLFTDDHSSFLYRLHLLKTHFPNLVFYNTDWNAGYLTREILSTGALNVFTVTAPFFLLGVDFSSYSGAHFYSLIIVYLFVLVVPASVYLASRGLGLTKAESVLAGVIALGPTLSLFEWVLKYGTIAFSFAAGLVPITFYLLWRLIFDCRPFNFRCQAVLLFISFLCLSWPVSFVAFLPLLVSAIRNWRTVTGPDRRWRVAFFVVMFFVLNSFWAIKLLQEIDVLRFVSGSAFPGSRAQATVQLTNQPTDGGKVVPIGFFEKALKRAPKEFREFKNALRKINPLIIIFAPIGFYVLRRRSVGGNLLGMTILWLVFISYFGELVAHHLELGRMLITASYLGSILSAVGIVYCMSRLTETLKQNSLNQLLSKQIPTGICFVALAGTTLMSPVNVASAYLGRSDEKYHFARPIVENLANAIKKEGGDGRTFFLGFILHELSSNSIDGMNGAHIAPLALFSGKELYASDFYHRRWTIADPIPESYRKRGRVGVEEFLDLVNATAVVTFKKEWAEYCLGDPRYVEVFHEDRFRVFTRRVERPSYFLEGDGKVERITRGLKIQPKTKEVVIKYRYFPGLVLNTKEGVELFSKSVFEAEAGSGQKDPVSFIGLRFSDSFIAGKQSVDVHYR